MFFALPRCFLFWQVVLVFCLSTKDHYFGVSTADGFAPLFADIKSLRLGHLMWPSTDGQPSANRSPSLMFCCFRLSLYGPLKVRRLSWQTSGRSPEIDSQTTVSQTLPRQQIIPLLVEAARRQDDQTRTFCLRRTRTTSTPTKRRSI